MADSDEDDDDYYGFDYKDDDDDLFDEPPPPLIIPPHKPAPELQAGGTSLDFERVINQYSIQAIRDRILEPMNHCDDEDDTDDEQQRSYHKECQSHSYEAKKAGLEEDSFLFIEEDINVRRSYNSISHDHRNTKTDINPPPIMNRYKIKDHIIGYTGRTCTRWILTIAIGLLMGIIAIVLVRMTEYIVEWRMKRLNELWDYQDPNIPSNDLQLAIVYIGSNLLLASISACITLSFCPEAAGSGIPEVCAYLNGVRVHKFGRWSLFIVKIVATVLSVSSGLVCGPEGPFIHIGAILGLGVTKLYRSLLNIKSISNCGRKFINTDLAHFATDSERRDLISIGAAAGFASAFGAPIGGLMFVLEEASSYFPHPLLLRTLCATAIATLCVAINHGDLSMYSVISLDAYRSSKKHKIFLNRFEEMPLYVLNGALGGALGGIFVLCWTKIQKQRKAIFSGMKPERKSQMQLLEVSCLSILTSSLFFFLSTRHGACKTLRHSVTDVFDQDVLCEEPGKFNEMAYFLFAGRDEPIRAILQNPEQFDNQTLVAVGVSFFVLMLFTLGVALPTGIFMPTVLVGCTLGGFMGNKYKQIFTEEISPSTFALLGAAALLTGIQRSTVSLCVILVEGTGQGRVLIPVIITVVVARFVGDKITKEGLYETAIELREYPYLHHDEKKRYDLIQVKDIMSAPPQCLRPRELARTIAELLEISCHNGFPVIDYSVNGGKFLGIVRRDQLVALLECGVFIPDDTLNGLEESVHDLDALTPESIKWRKGMCEDALMNLAYHIKDDRYEYMSYRATGTDTTEDGRATTKAWVPSVRKSVKNLDIESLPTIVDEHFNSNVVKTGVVERNARGQVYVSLNPDYSQKWVNVAAVMNQGAKTVTEHCPVSTAKKMFTALGLRHLVVLGGETGGSVVGVVTRANLLASHIESLYGVPTNQLPGKL